MYLEASHARFAQTTKGRRRRRTKRDAAARAAKKKKKKAPLFCVCCVLRFCPNEKSPSDLKSSVWLTSGPPEGGQVRIGFLLFRILGLFSSGQKQNNIRQRRRAASRSAASVGRRRRATISGARNKERRERACSARLTLMLMVPTRELLLSRLLARNGEGEREERVKAAPLLFSSVFTLCRCDREDVGGRWRESEVFVCALREREKKRKHH
jgi:hypothetical protein